MYISFLLCFDMFGFFLKIIYLLFLLAALGLCCCTRAFSSCGERGLLFVVCGLLIAVACLLRSMGSRRLGFSSCGTQAQ